MSLQYVATGMVWLIFIIIFHAHFSIYISLLCERGSRGAEGERIRNRYLKNKRSLASQKTDRWGGKKWQTRQGSGRRIDRKTDREATGPKKDR